MRYKYRRKTKSRLPPKSCTIYHLHFYIHTRAHTLPVKILKTPHLSRFYQHFAVQNQLIELTKYKQICDQNCKKNPLNLIEIEELIGNVFRASRSLFTPPHRAGLGLIGQKVTSKQTAT